MIDTKITLQKKNLEWEREEYIWGNTNNVREQYESIKLKAECLFKIYKNVRIVLERYVTDGYDEYGSHVSKLSERVLWENGEKISDVFAGYGSF